MSAVSGLLLPALLSVAAVPADAARPLGVGFADDVFLSSSDSERAIWLDRAERARATIQRINVAWSAIAPATRPSGFDPADPADPAYNWGELDAAVRDASARGIALLFTVVYAPDWAEGARRSRTAPIGSWKPRPAQFAKFGQALARRFSGGFPDPARPERSLPRVRYYQGWNEANLSTYLTPQWKGRKPTGPIHYRQMLNAFYAAVKGVRHSNRVLTAGTAPYGDPIVGGTRTQPATFWRALLCLRGRANRPTSCAERAHFDIAAHHPINIGRPLRHALLRDDISTPDIGKLKRILRAAERHNLVVPGRRKPIWATELWWDSKPPDPRGVPTRRHARWIEQALFLLWKQGVAKVILLQIRDSAPVPSYPETLQSGIFLRDGRPKPAFRAVRFPFVAERLGSRRLRVWGIAPRSGRVLIERKRGAGWQVVERLRARRSRVFTAAIGLRGPARLRARAAGESSLVWRQR